MDLKNNYDTLVLSGGGNKGFCLIGGIQALLDRGYLTNINTYIGTSIGGIISYLLILGYTPIEIVVALHINKWLEDLDDFNFVKLSNGEGSLNYNKINEILEKLTLNKTGKLFTMSNLKQTFNKSLICCTYNMTECKTEYITAETHPDLPCLIALRMTSNIPLVFDRFKYMDCYYLDGAMTDVFPISKGIEIGKTIIGLYLTIDEKSLKDEPSEGLICYITKLLLIQMKQLEKVQVNTVKDKCVVIPISGKIKNALDFNIPSKVRLEMFSEGYDAVKKFYE